MNSQSLDQSIQALGQALKEISEKPTNINVDLADLTFLNFKAAVKGADNYGKGLIFSGHGTTKQIILSQDPDRFFVTEHIDLAKTKSVMINKVKVIDDQELGPSVQKSNLRELGRLKGLIVDGSISINQHTYYNAASGRLGLGTEEPNAALSVVDNGIEVIIGVDEKNKAVLGTFASHDVDIVSGSVARISVRANGDIDLGNPNNNPSTVRVLGKLSVGVNVPDKSVDLHVAGPVRIHNQIHMYAENPPIAGNYTPGDVIWNSNPRAGGNVGWICTRAGSPGLWNKFGNIA
jgi:hypothetical protein